MTSPTYCAPCIADLALVREAVTSVAGTASCMAHAVLLTHSTDDPGRRRQRLDALKDLAGGKAETAEPTEQVKLELLVQEYGLAGAMDMGQPARRGQQQQPPRQGVPSAPGEGRKSRRGRTRPGDRPAGEGGEHQPRGDQPRGERPPRSERRPGAGAPAGGPADGSAGGAAAAPLGETAPVTPAPGPAGEQVSAPEQAAGAGQSAAPDQSSGESGQPATAPQPGSAPEQPSQQAPAGEQAPEGSSGAEQPVRESSSGEQAPQEPSAPEQARQPSSAPEQAPQQTPQQPSAPEPSSAPEQPPSAGAPSEAPPSAPDA